jgi:hypothetical protein
MIRKMSFFDSHPKPDLLLKKNKSYLSQIIKKIKELDTQFVKSPRYNYFCGHVSIFFKLIQRIEPAFTWKKIHIKMFLLSFIMDQDTEAYNISEQSGFYQSLKNHVHAFNEYLNSNSQPQEWLPHWGQYIYDFDNWCSNGKNKIGGGGGDNENEIIQHEDHHQDEEAENQNAVLSPIHKIEENIRQIQNQHIPIINKATCIIQNIYWDRIRHDIKNNTIQNWSYTWTLFEDISTIFSELNPSCVNIQNRIRNDLDNDKWRNYIINHENKEHSFKEYFTTIREIFEYVGIPEHKDRYISLNHECNEIICVQSFEQAIPHIFQLIFRECEILYASLNNLRKTKIRK